MFGCTVNEIALSFYEPILLKTEKKSIEYLIILLYLKMLVFTGRWKWRWRNGWSNETDRWFDPDSSALASRKGSKQKENSGKYD